MICGKRAVFNGETVMRCADYTCPYWKKDEACEAADGCAGHINEIPCTPEDMKKHGCSE